jgi:hypothetical protein
MAPDPVGLPAETVLAWRQLCFFMWLLGRFNVGFGMTVFISFFRRFTPKKTSSIPARLALLLLAKFTLFLFLAQWISLRPRPDAKERKQLICARVLFPA